jgi:hypothetical protein
MSRAMQVSSDASAERWLLAMRSELDRRLASAPAGSTVVADASSATQMSWQSGVEVNSALAALPRSAGARVDSSIPAEGVESIAGQPISSSNEANERGRDASFHRHGQPVSEGQSSKDLELSAVGQSERPLSSGAGERRGAGSEPGLSDGGMSRGSHLSNVPSQAAARGSKKSRRKEMRSKRNAPATGTPPNDQDREIGNQSSRVFSANDRDSNNDDQESNRSAAWALPPASGSSAPTHGNARVKSDELSPVVARLDTRSGGQRGTVAIEADRLLAASESPEETLVLGSLMGLRQKKENVRWFRMKVAMVIGGLLMLIVTVYAWERIPEGWRNLIWDSLTNWFTGESGASRAEPGVSR